ncbi:MAG: type II toxin-antitoxin system prevent-host-death family antitoxin [Thermoanaerobaculia bacterium]
METIGAFDAKTRLSELLSRAAQGESFLITKHGRPVARLIPDAGQEVERITAAAERLRSFRGALENATLEELTLARHEGHRF